MHALCILVCSAFAYSELASGEGPAGVNRVPFHFNGLQIGIDVEWDFETASFVFDTGASRHLLDWRLLKTFPSKQQLEMGISNLGIPLGKLPASTIAESPIKEFANGNDIFFHTTDEMARGLGTDCSGLIAIPWNRDQVWMLSFTDESIELLASPDRCPDGTPFRVQIDRDEYGRIYFTGIGLRHGKSGFLVDTGSSSCITVDSTMFEKLVDSDDVYAVRKSWVSRLNESLEVRTGILRRFEFCGVVFENVPVLESNMNKVGVRLLSRFDWIFKNDEALAYPRDLVMDPFQTDQTGLTLYHQDGFVRVYSIESGSGAERSGFRCGDIVATVDRENVGAENLQAIRKRLATGGGTIQFEILRAGEGVLQKSIQNPGD